MAQVKWALAIGLVIATAGCAGVGYRVNGALDDGPETFSGSLTKYLDRTGGIEIQSTKGLYCNGPITYSDMSRGMGTLKCRDGQTGRFNIEFYGGTGRGSGEIGERKIAFTVSVTAAP